MNTKKLIPFLFLSFVICINGCAQNNSKPTTVTTPTKTTLPPHTYTYTPSTKKTVTNTKSVSTITTVKPTVSKTVSTPSTAVKTVPAAASSATSTTQSSKSSTPTSTTTGTTQTSATTSTGKAKMGTGESGTTTTTQTTQTTNTGKTKMGTGGSATTTGNNSTGNVLNTVLGNGSGNFTETDAASAIKEALMKGVTAGVSKVAVTDGYFKNSFIKIPFPEDAKVVESTLRSVGMGSMIDNLVLSLNRAAESAANQAGPIFVNGIKQMTVTDAINIVSNQQPDAATKFLQRTTTESLVSAFKPSIQSALDKTLATKYWKDIMSNYNKIPFVQKVNPDLNDFVTRKAISGVFYMVGQEEAKIRKDPVGQGSKIIETVFGSVLKH